MASKAILQVLALSLLVAVPLTASALCLQGSCPEGRIEISMHGKLRCMPANACEGLVSAASHSGDIVVLPRCGNGVCESDEFPKICPDDCGVIPVNEKNCGDGFDDDQDGLIDCSDPDCGVSPECPIAAFEKNCMDGLDDDGDGAVDCADSDCTNMPGCIVPDK